MYRPPDCDTENTTHGIENTTHGTEKTTHGIGFKFSRKFESNAVSYHSVIGKPQNRTVQKS